MFELLSNRRGQCAAVPRHHGKNTTLVAARIPMDLQGPWLFEGPMTTATFAWSIGEELAPPAAAGTGRRAAQPERPSAAASIREALANRHFASCEALEDAQAARCVVMQADRELVCSATCFPWSP